MRAIYVSALCLGLVVSAAGAQVGNNISVLNPNLADESELLALPELDAAQVDALIAARPLASSGAMVEALGDSLGEVQREALLSHLFVPINLNKASREEIMLVPGISRRMAHEFEEYRPYKSIEQFRREMGKYVDQDEVARLERYVELR